MLEVNRKNKLNSTWELTRASVDGLVQAIESGHNEVFSSYLETMARFHTYSARNVLLIAAQRPNATRVEGVRSWNELGRFVRPGEKGIFIFAPTVGFIKKENKVEENGKKPAKGKKAAEATKEPEQPEAQLLGFRGVYVFDVEQTGGEQLPDSRPPIDLAEKLEKLLAFAQSQQFKIEYSDRIAPAKAFSYRGVIRLLPGMEPAEAFPVLLREVASQVLYAIQRRTFVTRAIHQQETNAAAFVVCESLGLASKAAFADCQLYHGDARLLTESLEVVHRTAAQILGPSAPRMERRCSNAGRSRHFCGAANSPYARRLATATHAGLPMAVSTSSSFRTTRSMSACWPMNSLPPALACGSVCPCRKLPSLKYPIG
jgi:hypothetical protein